MPELPEVETVVRGLQPLVGSVVMNVDHQHVKGLVKNDGPQALTLLEGWYLTQVLRRGKWVQMQFCKPESYLVQSLTSHLGMFGSWLINQALDRHARLTLQLQKSQETTSLTYSDMRSWGRLYISSLQWSDQFLAERVGPDALQITLEDFCKGFHRRTDSIGASLMYQDLVAGIGNIYRCEILHRARIAPDRPCTDLTFTELVRVYDSMKYLLKLAIELKGSSISDYRDVDGKSGSFQSFHQVYQREGKECLTCGSLIQKVVWDRSIFYCATCQR